MTMHVGIACRNSIAALGNIALAATEQMYRRTRKISR